MRRIAMVMVWMLAGSGSGLAAAEVDHHLDLSLGTAYESNVLAAPSDEHNSASATSRVAGDVSWEGETNSVRLSVDGLYQPYESTQLRSISAIDASTAFTHDHEYGETRLNLGYSNASSLINAFEQEGSFVADERREAVSGSALRRFDLSETSSFSAEVDLSRVSFHDTPQGDVRSDYDFGNGELVWKKQLSERWTLGLGATGSWFETVGGGYDNRVTTVGPLVSASYAATDRWSATAEVSFRRDDTTTRFANGFSVEQSSNEYYGDLALTRAFDRGGISMALRRSVQPDSNGQQSIREEAELSARREITESVTVRAVTTYIDTQDNNPSSDNKGVASELHLDWSLGEHTRASLGYRYLWLEQTDTVSDVQAHSVALTFTRSFEGARR